MKRHTPVTVGLPHQPPAVPIFLHPDPEHYDWRTGIICIALIVMVITVVAFNG